MSTVRPVVSVAYAIACAGSATPILWALWSAHRTDQQWTDPGSIFERIASLEGLVLCGAFSGTLVALRAISGHRLLKAASIAWVLWITINLTLNSADRDHNAISVVNEYLPSTLAAHVPSDPASRPRPGFPPVISTSLHETEGWLVAMSGLLVLASAISGAVQRRNGFGELNWRTVVYFLATSTMLLALATTANLYIWHMV